MPTSQGRSSQSMGRGGSAATGGSSRVWRKRGCTMTAPHRCSLPLPSLQRAPAQRAPPQGRRARGRWHLLLLLILRACCCNGTCPGCSPACLLGCAGLANRPGSRWRRVCSRQCRHACDNGCPSGYVFEPEPAMPRRLTESEAIESVHKREADESRRPRGLQPACCKPLMNRSGNGVS